MKLATIVGLSFPLLTTFMLAGCQQMAGITGTQTSKEAQAPAAPEQPLYLCCNVRTETDWLSDGGFLVGRVMAAGTPVKLLGTSRGVANVEINGVKFRLSNEFGARFEPFDQWLKKVLVPQDPTKTIAAYPQNVQSAIKSGKIARGMTKAQVTTALGHPPAHANSNLDASEWTYMYNRWGRYIVQFDQAGRVKDVNAIGGWRDAALVQ